jgi:hypothetical protein
MGEGGNMKRETQCLPLGAGAEQRKSDGKRLTRMDSLCKDHDTRESQRSQGESPQWNTGRNMRGAKISHYIRLNIFFLE